MRLNKTLTRVGALSATVTLALALTACGNGSDGGGSDAPADTATGQPANGGGGDAATSEVCAAVGAAPNSDTVTLTMWESLQGPDQWVQQAGAAFTECFPNVTVNFVNVEIGDAPSQILLDAPAGTGPDVFVVPHDNLGGLVAAGMVIPVSNPDAVRANVSEGAALGATFNGVLYGFPTATETYALFYNRDLVDTPPTSWDDMYAFALDFNADHPGSYGFVFDIGAYYSFLFTTAEGNRLFGPSGDDAENTNINSAASVAGMEQFASLRPALDVDAGDLNTAIADALFSSGEAAMHISGPWNVQPFTDAGIDFGVTTLPSLVGDGVPATSFAGVRIALVSEFSANEDWAQLFAEFLTTPAMAQLRVDITGALSASSSPITYENPVISGFQEQMAYAFPMPSIPEMGRFWDAMNAASANIWNGADIQAELDMADAAIRG